MTDFDWYIANQAQLVQKYNGKVLVIKSCAVIGSYPTMKTAVKSTKFHKIGTCIVQKCSDRDQDYQVTVPGWELFFEYWQLEGYCSPGGNYSLNTGN